MADTLKFGPEWLRNLSADNHCRPQSPSAPTSRFKLADHRYSREEMLELFSTSDLDPPSDLKTTSKIFVEKPLEPVGFSPMSDAEQKLLNQMCSGAGSNNVCGGLSGSTRVAPTSMRSTNSLSQIRNSEATRKTRGSGRLDPIFYRSSTTDDDDYVRSRHFNRDPWDDSIPCGRGRGLSYSGRSFEESPDVSRSMAADNWRGAKKKWNDEDTGSWRKQFPGQKPSNRSWREPWEKEKGSKTSDDPFREKVFRRSFSTSHAQNSHHYDEESEQLPEWSTDDFDDVGGTFDASGAFMSIKELEQIEEQKLLDEECDFRMEEQQETFERDGCGDVMNSTSTDVTKENDLKHDINSIYSDPSHGENCTIATENTEIGVNGQLQSRFVSSNNGDKSTPSAATNDLASAETVINPGCQLDVDPVLMAREVVSMTTDEKRETGIPAPSGAYEGATFDFENLVNKLIVGNEEETGQVVENRGDVEDFVHNMPQQFVDEDARIFNKQLDGGLQPQQQSFSLPQQQQLQQFSQQFQQQQQMFSQQQQQQPQQSYIKGFVPTDHEDAYKWFYRDPQGEIQGPFSSLEMSEWFSVGYFNMNLLVKQGCDHNFLPVGTLVKLFDSNPFQISHQMPAGAAGMPHMKSHDLQQNQQLAQQLQQLHLKQQQQQQHLDQMKIMQMMHNQPRNTELLNKWSTFQLLQQLQQQLHNNNTRPSLLDAISNQSSEGGVPLSSIQQQIIQQHLQQKQQQQQLSQLLQQHQHSFPHRSFSQSNNESLPYGGGVTASNSTSYLLQANQNAAGSQQAQSNSVPSIWKTANDVKAWDKGIMGLELSRPITAQALEQLQYMALEKQQQRLDSSTPTLVGGINSNSSDPPSQMESISANTMAMGGVREQRLRALLQQEAVMRMSALSEERQKLPNTAEMIERQKMEELRRRQEKADNLRKQQEHLEVLKRIQQSENSQQQLLRLKQQQNKVNNLTLTTAINMASLHRHSQQLKHCSSPNFMLSSSSANPALDGGLSFQQQQQQQSLLQKQLVNKSWSLTNQSWMNGNNGHSLETSSGASNGVWGNNPIFPQQQQFHLPPSHSTATIFTNTTSNPHHLLDDSFTRSGAGLFGGGPTTSSAPSSALWQEGPGKNSSLLDNLASQQQLQVFGNGGSQPIVERSAKEDLILWCETELKDQVPNGNIPSIIQKLLDSSLVQEIVNIVKAFFADPEECTGFAIKFLGKKNQLLPAGQQEQHQAAGLFS